MIFDMTLKLPQVVDLMHLILFGAALLFMGLFIAQRTAQRSQRAKTVNVSDGSLEANSLSETNSPPKTDLVSDVETASAMQLLALLQREARLLDFIQEDVAQFSDEEVGVAARVVHSGTKKAIESHFTLKPIHQEEEGVRVTLPKGFDNRSIRLTGQVAGEPPFTGTLVHRGWQVVESNLPQVAKSKDLNVLAAAEVEL